MYQYIYGMMSFTLVGHVARVKQMPKKPGRAGPGRAEPSRAEPSRAEPSRESRAEPSRAESAIWENTYTYTHTYTCMYT